MAHSTSYSLELDWNALLADDRRMDLTPEGSGHSPTTRIPQHPAHVELCCEHWMGMFAPGPPYAGLHPKTAWNC